MLPTSKLSEMEYRQPTTAEEVLGIFLKEPNLFREYKNKLTPEMFTGYAWLFAAMLQLEREGNFTFRDIVLRNLDKMKHLNELQNAVVASTIRLDALIDVLKKDHLRAEMQAICQRMLEQSLMGDVNVTLSELQSSVYALSNTDAGTLSDPTQDVDSFYDWLDEIEADPSKAYGLMTGIQELDQLTTGFHRGDFIVIGARSSMGKSAFMIELALRMAINGYKVAIFSLEMSKQQLYLRMVANLTTMELTLLKTGRSTPTKIEARQQHKALLKRIYIDDTRAVSAEYITDSMRRLKRTQGLDVVMTDYIQDITEIGESNDNGGSAIARVCRKLRKGAQENDCVMFGISQVTRGVEERKDKRPLISDLSGSTGIETSADGIVLLYRDDYYNANTDKPGELEVNFAKQRNGEVGLINLYYSRKYQQIRPLSAGKW